MYRLLKFCIILIILSGCSYSLVQEDIKKENIKKEDIQKQDIKVSELLAKNSQNINVDLQGDANVNYLVVVNKNNTLSSEFVPDDLVVPEIPFSFAGDHEQKYLQKEVALSLEKMFKKAREENIYLYGLSGYRSFESQKSIFAYNVNRFGNVNEANRISAKPGQSEHQTGLVIDVTTKSINYQLEQDFENTPEGRWLKNNAHKFGFIIRYPKGKEEITGYMYEPWHLRYVRVGPATEIYSKDLTLEEYLALLELNVYK